MFNVGTGEVLRSALAGAAAQRVSSAQLRDARSVYHHGANDQRLLTVGLSPGLALIATSGIGLHGATG